MKWLKVFFGALFLLLVLSAAALGAGHLYFEGRGHGNVVAESYVFTESARRLENPNRGFYHMHGFRINDSDTDFRQNVAGIFCQDVDTRLTMVEVNLQNYRDGAVSEQGIANLENLFQALERIDKQLIVRFLYDWDGNNEEVEPQSLDIILGHMEQMETLLRKYSHKIFLLQGLFIGNWGEMNGTKYTETEDMQKLARKLEEVTDESTFLAVRMPAQWRKITQLASAEGLARGDGSLASRLGLYNDGMLGSWSDYGTYGDQSYETHGAFTYWNREEELAFQEVLCRLVPVGGEVIVDNPYNDFENAVKDFAAMHVTYLNQDYDAEVLGKWEAVSVEEDGVFNGMDGLSYIERHLGYRLLIRDAEISYDFREDKLSVDVSMQNVGFAPVYKEAEVRVLLYDQEEDRIYSYRVEQDIRDLTGGNDAGQLQDLHTEISLAGEEPGRIIVFLDIRDISSGDRILLANEQEAEEHGYRIGAVEIGSVEDLWEEWKSAGGCLFRTDSAE